MLKFILVCALVGGLVGLLFSRSGEGAEGFTEGARRGTGFGCGCILVCFFLLFLLAALFFGALMI